MFVKRFCGAKRSDSIKKTDKSGEGTLFSRYPGSADLGTLKNIRFISCFPGHV